MILPGKALQTVNRSPTRIQTKYLPNIRPPMTFDLCHVGQPTNAEPKEFSPKGTSDALAN
jgi:hypothetical protein